MSLFDLPPELAALDREVTAAIKPQFEKIDDIAAYNCTRVLEAFVQNRVSAAHFGGSTGYGYDDRGREIFEAVFAQSMCAEDALVRTSFLSGTHTLSVALFGCLRPGDSMLCLTGTPYDTLHGVLGISGDKGYGSLKEFGVFYEQCELKPDGTPDTAAISAALGAGRYKLVYIQRSRGYTMRPSLGVDDIAALCTLVRRLSPASIIMVDNCYGEFVEQSEPAACGADLIVGSLIKNAGGGLMPMGGYIAGRRELVELCGHRLSAPGVGREIGATTSHLREMFMGLYYAPHTVANAMKTAVYTAGLFGRLGFDVSPSVNACRADIIQSVRLETPERLIAFCRGIQAASPIDSFAAPEPAPMPGYDDEVIMAAGTFTGGSSIELSADAPLREPYAVFLQGGIIYEAAKAGVLMAAAEVMKCR